MIDDDVSSIVKSETHCFNFSKDLISKSEFAFLFCQTLFVDENFDYHQRSFSNKATFFFFKNKFPDSPITFPIDEEEGVHENEVLTISTLTWLRNNFTKTGASLQEQIYRVVRVKEWGRQLSRTERTKIYLDFFPFE